MVKEGHENLGQELGNQKLVFVQPRSVKKSFKGLGARQPKLVLGGQTCVR